MPKVKPQPLQRSDIALLEEAFAALEHSAVFLDGIYCGSRMAGAGSNSALVARVKVQDAQNRVRRFIDVLVELGHV